MVSLGIDFKDGELDNVRNQINNLQTNPINLTINTRGVQTQLDNIRRQILSLNNLRLNLGGSGGNGNGGIQRTVNEVTRAYNDLMNLQRRINSIRVQISGLDSSKNAQQISELSGQLNRLMTDYNNLYQTFNRRFSTDQIDNLSRAFEVASNKISATNAKMSDTASLKQTESAYKELYNTAKQISNLELKIGGLDGKVNANQIAELTNQLNTLQQTYNNMIASFNVNNGNLSVRQLSALNQICSDTQAKLSELDAKILDTKNKLANDIRIQLNTNEFTSSMATLESNFDKLRVKSTEIVTGMSQVKTALNDMRMAESRGDVDALIESYERYKVVLQDVSNQISINAKAEQTAANGEKLANAKTNLSLQMDVWLKNNSAAASQFGAQIKQLQSELQSCDAVRFSGIKSEFQAITREAELAGKNTKTFGDTLIAQWEKMKGYLSLTMIISQTSRALRSMYNNVLEIDSAMTELKKVTDETDESYNNFLNHATSRSQDIGTQVKDLVSSTADFARLGFDFDTSQVLAEVANIYAVVGDDIDSIDTATKSIISTLTAFGDEIGGADNAMAIADKFNEVGNRFAISSGGIGDAMTRSASSLQAANNTLDESIALITAANTVVQNPDSVGTAFKTISMRIRAAKTELEEAGLETEGMVESVADLREEILALSGVDIMIDDDTFKSTYQIMDELSQKWQDLTDIQQATITELIAGKRQGNIVSSLMNNFDIARQALEVSANSEGSAMKEHEKWMESLEAKVQQLRAAWEGLSQSFLGSDFLKGLVDGVTGFVNILDGAVEKFGTLPTLIGGISAALSFKNVGWFKTIEDEATMSGLRIQSVFIDAFNAIRNSATFSFDGVFTQQLNTDVQALTAYQAAVQSGIEPTTAFSQTMTTASSAAQAYAKSVDATKISITDFTAQQNAAEVALMAKNKSLTNVRSLIAEYNSGLATCGLTQQQFISAVGQSNTGLSKYLTGLNGAKASMTGYITSLIGAKAASIALQAATMALNVAISMGISIAISALVTAISNWINAEKEAREAALETGEAAKKEAENLMQLYNTYEQANAAYKSNTGSKDALNSATDALLSALGLEESEIQRLVEEYGNLETAIDNVTMTTLEQKLTELTAGYQASVEKLMDTTKDGWFSSFSMLDFSINDNDSRFADRLKNKNLIDSGSYGSAGGSIYLGDNESLEGVIELYQKLLDMQQELSDGVAEGDYTREELAQDDLWKSINERIDSMKEEYADVFDYIEQINEAAAQLSYMDYVKDNGVPETVEQFEALQSALENTAKSSGQFVGTTDQISDSITNTLSNIPELSQFFGNYDTAIADATKATEAQLNELKNTFANNDISKWFDSLSADDKQLMYEIGVRSDDTTLWTLTKWQEELKSMQDVSMTTEESLQQFYNTMNNTEEGNFSDVVKDYISNIETLREALGKLDTGEMTETDTANLVVNFPELAGHTDDVETFKNAILDLINTTNQGIDDSFAGQLEALGGEGTAAGQALLSLKEIIDSIGDTSGWNFDIDSEIEKFNNLYDAMKESVSGTGLSTEGIKNVESMFSGLKGYDPSVLFEKTEHGIHLNTTALRALQSQYEATTKLGIQDKLKDLKQQYNDTKVELEGLTEGTEEYNQKMAELTGIENQINDVQTLAAQYEGLTSAYNKWIMAQSAGEEGDMYDNITSSLEDIKQLYDDGLIGTNAFRSAVQMMSNEDLSTANIDKLISTYEAGYPAMQRYFTDSSDGCLQFLKDVESLNAEWAHMSEDGNWEINFGIGNDEEIANAISDMMGLQVSTEQVQIIMRKLSDYGFDIKLDSAYTSIEDLKSRIEETEEKLKELGQDPVDINVNADDIDAEIEKAKSKIQEISNSSADVDVKTAQLDDANAKLDVLINKKIEASQPAFMSIDVSQVDSEIQGALTALQEYQTAVNNLKALEIKGADTSEIEAAKGKVDELAGKIESLPTDVKTKIGLETDGDISSIKSTIEQDKIKIPVSADTTQATTDIQNIKGEDVQVKVTTTGNEALDTLKSALDGLTDKTINVSANVTGTENLSNLKTSVGALVNKTVTATATAVGKDNVDALKKSIDSLYNRTVTETAKVVGTNLVDALKKAIDNLYSKTVSVGANVFGTSAVNALKSAIDSLKSKTVTATTVTKKVAGVDGTAHADGTAFVRGDWGTKESGVALGGEEGQELVVRNGRFFTIGDKSAEFFKYQKGDIIFNAAQTKEIFEKGKITHGNGRGQALAEGTAFSSGSGKITSGGKTKKTVSGKSSSSSSKKSSSKSKSSKSSEKEFEETFDWIEVAIDRMERAISQLDLIASSTYKNWSTRNKKLQKEIQQVTAEIDLQQKGYNRYIQEANSVGLDEKWAKKVRDGTIDINTVKDEDLADKIKEYQQWYDKALDCKDAIDELNETISELYETAFNNVVSEYDGILSVVQHEQNMLEEYINQTEEKGYIVSTKYYDALIKNKEKSIADMEKERTALLSSLNDAVASGAIQKGSEAWYEMVNQIDEVTLAIEEANTEIIEFNNNIREIEWEIFDILQDKISQVTKESDFLINLLSSDKLYDDRGQLTNEGRSTMGLHGLNYNVYMSQADEYAKELLKINQELAKDPYNQTLAERRQELLELQQEMILAAEDEKQAIVDMVEEGIELELDALKDLIDTYTDALDAQKALYDYQNKIEEQTGEIASLEKQKAAYEGDDSEESRAKRQEIDKSLEKARKDLEETEYDKYISDQKELLDNLYLEYETILNERLDNVDALISDMIFEINNSAISINETLNQAASSVGYTLTEEMRNIWGLAAQQMEADAARRVDDVTRLVNQLVANGQLSQADAQSIITALGNGDAQGIANATNIINQLVAQGQLSQADATNIQNTMKSTGADYKGVITTYGTDFQNKHTTTQATLDNIKANVAAMVQQANQQAAAKAQQAAASSAATSAAASGKATTSSPAPSSTPKSNSSSNSSKKTTTTSKKDRTEKEYYGVALAIWNGNYGWGTGNTRVQRLKAKGFDANKVQSIVNQMGKEGYVRSGAWVGRYKGITSLAPYHYNKFESGAQKINKDQFAWTQEKGQEFIVRPSDGAILTPVARNDSILDADASSNIWDMANNPTDFVRDNLNLDDINIPNNMMAHNNYTQNLDKVIFNLPNVKNYDELLYMMQHDRNFERLILSMTIDRLAGKSSLAKYHAIRGKSY